MSCTSAQGVALRARPRTDAFVAAVGAFTPRMVEWAPEVCRWLAEQGLLVVDTRDADHEAGDLLQAGIDVPALRHTGRRGARPGGAPAQRAGVLQELRLGRLGPGGGAAGASALSRDVQR